MKKCKEVNATFGPDIGFAIKPSLSTEGSGPPNSFQRLKHDLLVERLGTVSNQDCRSRLRTAADEAACEALATLYPLLVFPALFIEKAEGLARQRIEDL